MFSQRLTRSSRVWTSLSDRAVTPRLACQSIQQKRNIHHVPVLTYDPVFTEHGVPGLFSNDGYNIAWTRYMDLMVKRLNEITVGFEAENQSTKQIVLQYARNPATATLFNHASMAFNNHFFFGALSPAPEPLSKYTALQSSLIRTFGSIETLRETMLSTADAMFGPGFVWLVATKAANERHPSWRILNTYLAGTPFAEAGYRQQDKDMNTVANNVGTFGPTSQFGKKDASIPPGAALVQPVLCVSTWEHVYLRDFGVEGKQEFLAKWWDAIHWGDVDSKTPAQLKEQFLGQTFAR